MSAVGGRGVKWHCEMDVKEGARGMMKDADIDATLAGIHFSL